MTDPERLGGPPDPEELPALPTTMGMVAEVMEALLALAGSGLVRLAMGSSLPPSMASSTKSLNVTHFPPPEADDALALSGNMIPLFSLLPCCDFTRKSKSKFTRVFLKLEVLLC